MGEARHPEVGPLDPADEARVARAEMLLEAIPVGGRPAAVYEALRVCAPVAGGLIGVMGEDMNGTMTSHVVDLPQHVLEGWATTPIEQLHKMMEPLAVAGPGAICPDRREITGDFREQIDLLRVMEAAGYGEAAGYKISIRRTPAGRREQRFLTLALADRALFAPRDHDVFARLRPSVEAALARIDVPLLAAEPIFAQILDERRYGYLLLARGSTIVELNERAHSLIARYARTAGIEPGRGVLDRFVQRALVETQRGAPWNLVRVDGRGAVVVTAHRLAKEVHAVGEDLRLVMINETELAPDVLRPRVDHLAERGIDVRGLTDRQLEVAWLLGTTDLSYKQVAEQLGIAVGTVRKHVEHVYRAFGVRSRASLAVKLR